MNELKFLVLHCTATPAGRWVTPQQVTQWHMGPREVKDKKGVTTGVVYKGKTYPSLNDLPNDVIGGVPIRNLRGNGWDRDGYWKLILLDGTLHEFYPNNRDAFVQANEVTWGAIGTAMPRPYKNQLNWFAIHVCYVGGMSADFKRAQDTRTLQQVAALKSIIKDVISFAPGIQILGHNQADPKACPSFWVPKWLRDNKTELGITDANIYTNDPYNASKFKFA